MSNLAFNRKIANARGNGQDVTVHLGDGKGTITYKADGTVSVDRPANTTMNGNVSSNTGATYTNTTNGGYVMRLQPEKTEDTSTRYSGGNLLYTKVKDTGTPTVSMEERELIPIGPGAEPSKFQKNGAESSTGPMEERHTEKIGPGGVRPQPDGLTYEGPFEMDTGYTIGPGGVRPQPDGLTYEGPFEMDTGYTIGPGGVRPKPDGFTYVGSLEQEPMPSIGGTEDTNPSKWQGVDCVVDLDTGNITKIDTSTEQASNTGVDADVVVDLNTGSTKVTAGTQTAIGTAAYTNGKVYAEADTDGNLSKFVDMQVTKDIKDGMPGAMLGSATVSEEAIAGVKLEEDINTKSAWLFGTADTSQNTNTSNVLFDTATTNMGVATATVTSNISSTDVIAWDTAQIQQYIARLKTVAADMDNARNSLKAIREQVSANWSGNAAATYIAEMCIDLDDFKVFGDNVGVLINALSTVTGIFTDCETSVTASMTTLDAQLDTLNLIR